METNNNKQPIDLAKIAKTLWPHRRHYCYVMGTTLVVTYLIILCIPRYYKCKVSLAPETSGVSVSGSLGSLASSFGLGSSLAKMNSQDAIYSEIYPDVLKSKNFIAELMTVDIKTKDGTVACNYYTYLRDKQKDAWWNTLKSKITEWISPGPTDNFSGKEKLKVFDLNEVQSNIFNSVPGKIKCAVDKKTEIVTIEVEDQDPLVCATMADATCSKLQQFITEYRTNKARIDYMYYQKLCEESKATYDKSVKAYASAADANRNAVLVSYTVKESALENEMQANYTVYTAMKSQMQAAAAKLQEATPAFTIIESASVPVKPAGPRRMIISLGMMLLSGVVFSGWLLMKAKL
jgi:capsular polysaccharide biosynthesis protein